MIVYWALFAFFAVGAIQLPASRPGDSTSVLVKAGLVLIALAIGLRFEVGGDWSHYIDDFKFAQVADFGQVMSFGDPGYEFASFVVAQGGGTMWMLNLVMAMIFVIGLYLLAREQPLPWLTVLVAIPYLVIVVAMGYTRQAVAIGVLMAGLAALQRNGNIFQFAIYVMVAALFHRTAVTLLPIVIFSARRGLVINVIGGLLMSYALYSLFLDHSIDGFIRGYVKARYNSSGAAIRLAMDLVPAVIVLGAGRRLGLSDDQRKIWYAFALTTLVALAIFAVSPSSTAVDRLALYLIPMQLVVLPRAAAMIGNQRVGRGVVVAYLFAIQFTWLNYAVNAIYWVPYKDYLSRDSMG